MIRSLKPFLTLCFNKIASSYKKIDIVKKKRKKSLNIRVMKGIKISLKKTKTKKNNIFVNNIMWR